MSTNTAVHPLIIALSFLLCLSVLLSGIHAKEIAGLPLKSINNPNTDDAINHKITAELHNHVDKQTVHSLIKISADTQQADHRAFRHVRHQKDDLEELKDALFGMWNRMKVAASFLMF